MKPDTFIVVAWWNQNQIDQFLNAWWVPKEIPNWLVLQQDFKREGCAVTKNRGVVEAIRRGAETVVILDDDCYPYGADTLELLATHHENSLLPVRVNYYRKTSEPQARGTPYINHQVLRPVAASLGFWREIGDYDACHQLVIGAKTPMKFIRNPAFERYFSLCGMNVAFKPKEWLPWCQFIDVPRFDDIWMGWLWQKEAYRRGYCFNLGGPDIVHARQSNVWQNLRDEAKWLERNETIWSDIAESTHSDYFSLRGLLPV